MGGIDHRRHFSTDGFSGLLQALQQTSAAWKPSFVTCAENGGREPDPADAGVYSNGWIRLNPAPEAGAAQYLGL